MRCHIRRVAYAALGVVVISGLLLQLHVNNGVTPHEESHVDMLERRDITVHLSQISPNLTDHRHGSYFSWSSAVNLVNDSALLAAHSTNPFSVPHLSSSPSSHQSRFGSVNLSHIWPEPSEWDDRIPSQMSIKPKAVSKKLILVYNGVSATERSNKRFIKHECPVTDCDLTGDANDASIADAILFEGNIIEPTYKLHKSRPANQLWILFFLESPSHTVGLKHFYGKVNWTATYRRDSTIVTPYERWTPFTNFTTLPSVPDRNYAAGKTKQVAWFVSNCGARNGRLKYAEELGKYINVDIYGHCGSLKCPRSKKDQCHYLLKNDYKFYLAFENSNCRDYITEKLYWNAYLNDILPIVMGARPEDYERSAPPHSYIHVDNFSSPRALADYLHLLDANDHLYNQYFRWKGTGSYIDTKFWCRLCSMVHESFNSKHKSSFNDLESWWRGADTCRGVQPGQDWATWRS